MISFFGIDLMVTSLMFVAIDGNQFCESYANNSYKVLVHSPDNRVLTLVVDKHYWFVDPNGESLVFRTHHKPSGSNDIFSIASTLFPFGRDYIGFYDVRHEYH